MKKTAIFFGSSTGNTETVAEAIASKLGADLFNVEDSPSDKFEEYDNLIFGTSTWGIGDLQDDWDDFISEVEDADLSGKVVALFGLGDSSSYPDSFVDGIGAIYEAVKDKDCKVVGFVDTDGYDYEESAAEVDGKFVGLPIDEDNESDMTDERIEKWVEQLKGELS